MKENHPQLPFDDNPQPKTTKGLVEIGMDPRSLEERVNQRALDQLNSINSITEPTERRKLIHYYATYVNGKSWDINELSKSNSKLLELLRRAVSKEEKINSPTRNN